ncbi:uncharacterized protein [Macrobrachium rosenbergii]|uniref:uncharacterized protein n=1 Tax=Macrobrachium rosenbergii TaxID=79674 RepID=UPI0034D3B5FD
MKRYGELPLEELQEAKNKTIAIIQSEFFQEEYECLMKGVRKTNQALIHQLNLYLDNRAIRCVDYTGALWVKGKGQSPEKAFVILFTCLITRVIHVLLVDNQSCDSFLMSFRSFCSRRGLSALMLSDNATTFVVALEYLKTMSENPMVKEYLLDIKCNWKFIPARAPRFGAIWERLIELLKSCLKKIVGQALLSFEELTCVLVKVEGIISDRTLSYEARDLNQLEILTPNLLILEQKLKSFPREVVNWEEISGDPTYGRREFTEKRFLYASKLCDDLWKRWEREYLTMLRENHREEIVHGSWPRIGKVVLIHDEGPRSKWKLGQVIKLHMGQDKI